MAQGSNGDSGGLARRAITMGLFHIRLDETRHWAQIAMAIRRAGLGPPGNHDLFSSTALR